MPSTPLHSGRDLGTMNRDSMGNFADLPSPSPERFTYRSPDLSLAADMSGGSALQRSRRTSDMSTLSADLGYRAS